ncbi:MAG: DUF4197 domain-containing protein, partial [Sulfurospirillaceae bacterium]|nr:DUF4197 domain-containing protein [Sulfurospirillaceae bacterium]
MFKKTLIALTPALLCAGWQDTLSSVVSSQLQNNQSVAPAKTSSQSPITQDYASKGLKEALNMGINQAVSTLGRDGGFLNNSAVKIPMPSSMKTVASVAEKVGGKSYVDDFVTTMNVAAAKSVPKTAEILGKTVADMNMEDAKAIIAGGQTAATDYFKQKSSSQLLNAIMPIIKQSTSESKVMSAYQTLNSFYANNKSAIPGGDLLKQAGGFAKSFGADQYLPQSDEDIEGYVARKTLDGFFYMIG